MKKIVSIVLIIALLFSGVPKTILSAESADYEEYGDDNSNVYITDLFYGYSKILTNKAFIGVYETDMLGTVAAVQGEYVTTLEFKASALNSGYGDAFSSNSAVIKYYMDKVGITEYEHSKHLDIANAKFVQALCGEEYVSFDDMDTISTFLKYSQKVVDFNKDMEKFALDCESYKKDKKSAETYNDFIDWSFAYLKEYFTYIDPDDFDTLKTKWFTYFNTVSDNLKYTQEAMEFTKGLITSIFMHEMQLEIVNEIMNNQESDTLLYKGMERYKKQLEVGFIINYSAEYIDNTFIDTMASLGDDLVYNIIGEGYTLAVKICKTAISLTCDFVMFACGLTDPDDYMVSIVLMEYARNMYDYLESKTTVYNGCFVSDEIAGFEKAFDYCMAASKLALNEARVFAKYNNEYDIEFVDETLNSYSEDMYVTYINLLKDYLKTGNREMFEIGYAKGTVVLKDGKYEVLAPSDVVEQNKLYTFDNKISGNVELENSMLVIPEGLRVEIKGNLYIDGNSKVVNNGELIVNSYSNSGNLENNGTFWVDDYNAVEIVKEKLDKVNYNGHTYYLFDNVSVSTWEEAELFCQSMGGHLATISSKEENDFLYQYMISQGYKSAFFGYTDREKEGEWRWITSEDINYENWAAGEPNDINGGEDYAMFYSQFEDGTWNDSFFYTDVVVFLCEWDNEEDTYAKSDKVKLNGSTYYIFPKGTVSTWEEAKEYCEKLGGHLATITSQEENDCLYKYMIDRGYESAYFGYTDEEKEGEWKCVNSETTNYENWAVGEPNNQSGGENYAMFYHKPVDGKWNDGCFNTGITAHDTTAFICEWDDVEIDSIDVIRQPNKQVYNVGDEFVTTGMEVIAKCTDGTVYTTNNYKIEYDFENVGKSEVVIKYLGYTDTIRVDVIDKLSIAGASLALHDNITIKYKVSKEFFETKGYSQPYIMFEMNGKYSKVSEYMVDGDYYIFEYNDISPAMMGDKINSTLYATYNGIVYSSDTREYSVTQYCNNILSKYKGEEYVQLRRLIVDLLNYGAATQQYCDYNVDSLVNSQLTEAQLTEGTQTVPVYENRLNREYAITDEAKVVWKGAGLVLKDSIQMRFIIEAESVSNLVILAESKTETWRISSDKFESLGNNLYYVYFNGFDASQMEEILYLTAYENSEVVSNTITYSIESYAYAKQNDENVELTNLLIAMINYGKSAYLYNY